MVGIDFAAHKGKNIANSTLIRTVIRGLLKNGHKKTPQENSYGVWDRKKALILSYQRLFFRRYLILNLTPRSLPPKNIVLPTNSMFSYPEAGNGCLFFFCCGYGIRKMKCIMPAAPCPPLARYLHGICYQRPLYRPQDAQIPLVNKHKV